MEDKRLSGTKEWLDQMDAAGWAWVGDGPDPRIAMRAALVQPASAKPVVRQEFEGRVEEWLNKDGCEGLCVELPKEMNCSPGDRVRVERIEQ